MIKIHKTNQKKIVTLFLTHITKTKSVFPCSNKYIPKKFISNIEFRLIRFNYFHRRIDYLNQASGDFLSIEYFTEKEGVV